MRSVQNIAKITSAMKMVAASKMRVAQSQTEKSRGMLTPFLTMLGDLPGMSPRSKLAEIGIHEIPCDWRSGDHRAAACCVPEVICSAMQLWR